MRNKLLLCLLAALLCAAGSAAARAASVRFSYAPDFTTVYDNPYIGNVVWASDGKSEQPFTLVYANLLWSDFEPNEGEYDFASFEEKNQFSRWRAEGKHLVLRLVADKPDEKKHMDIPQWLYDQTGDGAYYKTGYGRGYSPNYENPVLIAAHARAVQALGERYGDDPFVAFVQLGSLGHWGEWHVHRDVGELPDEGIRWQYVEPYLNAFPNAYVMARRPFRFAAENGLGLFNDSSAEVSSTEDWLQWIADGGAYQDEPDALSPMPDGWKTAPIGGELASDLDMEALLVDDFDTTLRLFQASHTSWIGPHSFAMDVEKGGEWQQPLDQLLTTVGYRLRLESATLTDATNEKRQLTLCWRNDGTAPFYFDWQPTLWLRFDNGEEQRLALDMRMIEVLPEEPYEITLTLPEGAYEASVGIVDPQTGEAGVRLAMHAVSDGRWYRLFELK